ncbi:CHASE2 domain-containing protein [Dapis sp. BLCC M126]|uniref:CHASE2 domain-containing protein n=1 Tax=Dapis sp. BLCC M126 TaxID=3400189 RepID=UPI003CEB084C
MTSGGSLPPNSRNYVVRKQDTELLEKLLAGEYCYVFNARQMGKSSMRVRVMKKLRSQGCKCIPIDMTRLGDFSIEKQSWYEGFLGEIFYGCDLTNNINYQDWIASHRNLTNIQIFARFIEEILFINFPYPQKIYIFLDEIDVLVKLPLEMRNDFFAFIRSCYNRRAEDGKCDYHRLIFAFVGVATPDDLIRDPQRTPFNVGYPIELTELTFENGKEVLTKKLEGIVEEPEVVLKKVFDWTGGQPFLTQKLCQIIIDYAEDSEPDVDNLVEEHILTYWEEKDNPTHFKYMHDYLVNHVEFAPQLLRLYQEILQKGEVKTDDSSVQMALRLSGIVIKRQKKLFVFNKIYQKIFNENWVEEKLAEKLANLENNLDNSKAKPKTLGMSLGIASFVGVGVIILRTLGLLQSFELNEYDRLMRWRPSEPPDPRLLIVEATAKDINEYGVSNSLTDDNLAKVIAKLETHQPAIIGLDYLREKPLPDQAGYQKLLQYLSNNKKIIAVCSISDDENNKNEPSTKPPTVVEKEERFGFIQLILDIGQVNVIRRHLMFQNKISGNPCQTEYSLSVKVALNYLKTKGIQEENAPRGFVKIGQVIFKDLLEGQGFYQKIDSGGFQVLLNYRNSDVLPSKLAESITISDVLDNNFDESLGSLVKDKIILIGNTDPRGSDNFYTPYSFQLVSQKQMPGVIVHGHQVSQIISAILDGRPLITFWDRWVDWLWILGYSAVGGVVGWYFHRVLLFVFFIGGNIMVLYLVSLIFLTHGFVVPLVPSVLTLVITSVSVFINFERSPPPLTND